jgi:hypothetical protein
MSLFARYCRRCGGSIPGSGRHSCEGHRASERKEYVVEHDGKWWHWDIGHYRRVGPFDTEAEARRAHAKMLGLDLGEA